MKVLAKDDTYINNEINEMLLLLKYNETMHLGHSLAFVKDYVVKGEKPICVGHSLAHYYIFLNHGENETAKENLKDTETNFDFWSSQMKLFKSNTYIKLVSDHLENVKSGNNSVTDQEVNNLAELPCA